MMRVGFIIELTDVLPIRAPGQSSSAVGGVMLSMPGLTPMIVANRIGSTPSSRTIGEHRRRGQQDARHNVQQHADQHCGKTLAMVAPLEPARAGTSHDCRSPYDRNPLRRRRDTRSCVRRNRPLVPMPARGSPGSGPAAARSTRPSKRRRSFAARSGLVRLRNELSRAVAEPPVVATRARENRTGVLEAGCLEFRVKGCRRVIHHPRRRWSCGCASSPREAPSPPSRRGCS